MAIDREEERQPNGNQQIYEIDENVTKLCLHTYNTQITTTNGYELKCGSIKDRSKHLNQSIDALLWLVIHEKIPFFLYTFSNHFSGAL